MRAQQLSALITIEQSVTGQDAYGAPLDTWEAVATVWASVIDVSGREYFAAQATQNAAQTRITIRYLQGVLPAMRVVHEGTIYDIEAVLGQDKRMLTLICKRLA